MSEASNEIKSAQEVAQEKSENIQEKENNKQEEIKQEPADKQFQSDSQGKIKLTFYSYLIMLGAIGWQFLGKIPNPQTGKIEKDLLQVQEIIDLLEILEQKTKGNLSKEEENIMKTQLSNLRLNYVEELKTSSDVKK